MTTRPSAKWAEANGGAGRTDGAGGKGRSSIVLAQVRRRHVLHLLREVAREPQTRRELQDRLRLSRNTVSAIAADLIARRLLHEQPQRQTGPGQQGRPAMVLGLNGSAGAAIGIEIGRSRVTVTALGFDGSVIATRTAEDSAPFDPTARLQTARELLQDLLRRKVINPSLLVGIGVAVAGRHAPHEHPLGRAEVQPDPQGLDLSWLRARFAVPVSWDNNVRLAAVAEVQRDNRTPDLIYVALSAGVSCGVVVNGTVLRGGGAAGEFGHTSIDPRGPRCWCGGRGCLETYLGTEELLRQAARAGMGEITVHDLLRACHQGERRAQKIIGKAGMRLGTALANLLVVLDTPVVVLGGELAELEDLLLEPVQRAAQTRNLGIAHRERTFRISRIGTVAPSIGAGTLALTGPAVWEGRIDEQT